MVSPTSLSGKKSIMNETVSPETDTSSIPLQNGSKIAVDGSVPEADRVRGLDTNLVCVDEAVSKAEPAQGQDHHDHGPGCGCAAGDPEAEALAAAAFGARGKDDRPKITPSDLRRSLAKRTLISPKLLADLRTEKRRALISIRSSKQQTQSR